MDALIGLVGAKRSGKDTVAGFLLEERGFERRAFADALKRVALKVNPLVDVVQEFGGRKRGVRLSDVVDAHGWEDAKGVFEVRRLLQEIGVAFRDEVDENVWVRVVEDSLGSTPVVVTDVRFPNEVDMIRRNGGTIVRVVRPGLTRDAADAHISERALDTLQADATITNDGSLASLREKTLSTVDLLYPPD